VDREHAPRPDPNRPGYRRGTLAVSAEEPSLFSLSWTDDSARLYAVDEDRRLWEYDPNVQALKQRPDRLPEGTRAIQARPDGNLLLLGESQKCDRNCDDHHDGAAFQVYNFQTRRVAHSFEIDSGPRDLQIFTWNNRCGNPDPGGKVKMIQKISVDKASLCPNDEVQLSIIAQHPDGPFENMDPPKRSSRTTKPAN